MWRRLTPVAVALAVLQAQPCSVLASEPTKERVLAWVQGEWARADSVLAIPGQAFRYTVTTYTGLSPSTIADLRAQVAGHPDHPKKAELEAAEKELRDGPAKKEY